MVTIIKYLMFACQVGILVCGLGLLVWHILRLTGVINDRMAGEQD